MSKYTTPDGLASIETGKTPLSETTYIYPEGYKNRTIENLLQECLKLQTRNEELEKQKREHDRDILRGKR